MNSKIDSLYEELICLMEILGHLSPEANQRVVERIREITAKIKELNDSVAKPQQAESRLTMVV